MSEQIIRARVGERSFQLGQGYFQNGAIFQARRQGLALKARCQGSREEAYRVQVVFERTGIANAVARVRWAAEASASTSPRCC